MLYDFIIVGAGVSGSALAGRLAQQKPFAKILLLESGGKNNGALLKVPVSSALSIPFRSSVNYGYKTSPQAALNQRSCYLPLGKGLGGGSAINAMVYIRGHREDYNQWAQLGCVGWSWPEVLPYFIRAENNSTWNTALHGTEGPLPVANLKTVNPASIKFVEAARHAGFRVTEDFNGEHQDGVGFYQVFQKDGQRFSAYQAYSQYLTTQNVTVLTHSITQRLIVKNGTVTGVEVQGQNGTQHFFADKEVILCAGAIGTPHLLMCSGIGPAAVLQRAGVPLIHDSPHVGQNLQDHIDYVRCVKVTGTELLGVSFKGTHRLLKEFKAYRSMRDGMFSSNGAECGGFLKTAPSLAQPDIQMHFVIAMMDNHGRTPHYGHGYSCHTCLLKPLSRGHVSITHADIKKRPLINIGLLSNSHDTERLIRGIHMMNTILSQPPLLALNGKPLRPLPINDAEWESELRRHAQSAYHPVGTCAMGRVVTPTLNYIGLQGLRIADASIMPTIISGNTQAACAMIGEKAADLIIADHYSSSYSRCTS